MSVRRKTLGPTLFVILSVFSLAAANSGVQDQTSDKTTNSGVSTPQSNVLRSPQVMPEVHRDHSFPLALMPLGLRSYSDAFEIHPPLTIPRPPSTAADRNAAAAFFPAQANVSAVPLLSNSFQGLGNGFTGPQGTYSVVVAPPDTNGDVGPNHYVQIVNTSFAIFDKNGTVLYGPAPINTIWSGFGGGCENNDDGDPVVLYDSIADRWIVSQFSERTLPYLECVAVSQTPDPTGAYFRYSFSYGFTEFPDYPKLAVWPDGYYATYNIFRYGITFVGARACVFDRASMLKGLAATQQCFDTGASYGGLLPADLDGTQLPPAGSPNYLLSLGTTNSDLALWKFHVDWVSPQNSTFTGPASIPVAPYVSPCNGTRQCIPQANTTVTLDALSDRLMYRLPYRNFGDHESLVANHSIAAGSSVGIRWYEIRNPGATPILYQQGTYAPDSDFRWMGSIALDQSGGIGLGFTLSGPGLRPGIRYTGRLASDPLGTMPQGEGTIFDGGGSQTGTLYRWGDYSMMAVDPVDDCTFWYTSEYIPSDGSFNWRTYIGSFKLPLCGPTSSGDFSVAASPTSLPLTSGSSGTTTISTAVVTGSPQSISFTVSGLPAGATATFDPASVNAGDSSTLTVNSGTAYNGTYSITVTGTAGTVNHDATLTLTITGGIDPTPITNGGFETGSLAGWTSIGTTSVIVGGHSGTYAARTGSTSATSGDSSISQTFNVPLAGGILSFYYKISCPSSVYWDWVNVSLKDNVTKAVTTIVGNTCATNSSWVQVNYNLASQAGHSVTLTLLSHDDGFSYYPTYALFDDVSVSATTNDFSISANPTILNIGSGGSGTSTISTAVTSGSTQTVALSVSGVPTGATATFSPASVTAGGSSTLTFNAGSASAGTYTLTITGSAGSTTHTTSLTITVAANDFSISANPTTLNISTGGSGTSTISTAVTSGSTQTVALSVSGVPTGATASFSPSSISAGANSTLTFNAGSALSGTYTLIVTGTAGLTAHNVTVTVTITGGSQTSVIANGDFESGSLSGWTSYQSTSVISGGHTGNYAAKLGLSTPSFGDSTISQTFTVPAAGGILSLYYKMTCPDVTAYDWANVKLRDNVTSTLTTILPNTCATNSTWVQASFDVSANAGHSVTLTLLNHDDFSPGNPSYTLFDDVVITPKVVGNDFSISANPNTLSMAPNGSGTSVISTAVTSGSPQTVALNASGIPSGATASFTPTSVTAGNSSTLTFNAGSALSGTYTLTVSGTAGTTTHSATVTVTITGNDFSISANPTSLAISSGGSGTSTISTAVTSGSPQTVALSVSGLPTGATASFSPASMTAGSNSTFTVQAGTAANGTYSLTVTGTGTSVTHTTPVSLTIGGGGSLIANGGFETGSLTGWSPSGTVSIVSGGHTGAFAVQLGTNAPTSNNTITQTFTVPSTAGTLSFWYKMTCPDNVFQDWVTVTLRDNSFGIPITLLPNTCSNDSAWVQVTMPLLAFARHSVTLTLTLHDDGSLADPSYVLVDDVTIQ